MMVNGLILLIQVGLLALLVLLAIRMIRLVRSEPLAAGHQKIWSGTEPVEANHSELPSSTSEWPVAVRKPVVDAAPDRAELITRLHILAGLQERDCRGNGLELATAPEAVKAYAAAWLYGAGCTLSDKSTRHSPALVGIVTQIASRKTGIRQPEAVQAITTLTASTVYLACFRAGLEGAEFWRHNHYVPPASSLYEAITANAFI
ncbi:VanW family protein [Marinobacter adhaerens]|uniref:VanW family protein n=1 Tax=Marinobacter adhaerens TaxID=1033846 RepID=UPI001E2FC89D|nr:VanW family protein [Marinobacter adhaerens]MCD1647218.1 VanW family protein [Marinobacter adhaerens]